MDKESFAMYGLELAIFADWRVEMNPKNTREKADIAFHTPKGSRFFVSWGNLEDATKRFANLKEHRDASVKQLRTGQVTNVRVLDSRDDLINGHHALLSHIGAEVSAGMFSKKIQEKEIWSAHFYCPEKTRYYIIYCLLQDPSEYQNIGEIFAETVKSTVCH